MNNIWWKFSCTTGPASLPKMEGPEVSRDPRSSNCLTHSARVTEPFVCVPTEFDSASPDSPTILHAPPGVVAHCLLNKTSQLLTGAACQAGCKLLPSFPCAFMISPSLYSPAPAFSSFGWSVRAAQAGYARASSPLFLLPSQPS